MWSGLGINLNFTASGIDIPTQLTEIYNAGFRLIRLNVLDYNSSQSSVDNWKGYTQTALTLGFSRVVFGFGAGTTHITSSNWSAYSTALQGFASWFQAQNDHRLEFQIGNEEELHHDGSITDATLRNNLRTLASACKAIYTGPVSYASSISTGTEVANWGTEGIGSLDRIGFNLYGTDAVFLASANSIRPTFGLAGYVSEWGTNNGYQDFNAEQAYADKMDLRGRILVNAGLEATFVYSYMEGNNKWGLKVYPDTGYYRTTWYKLLQSLNWKGYPTDFFGII